MNFGLMEPIWELADDPAGDHVGHVEDVADVSSGADLTAGVRTPDFVPLSPVMSLQAPNPNLKALHEAGVSIWLDTLSRELLETGLFSELIEHCSVSGATSNPTIFAKAIAGSDRYDDQLRELKTIQAQLEEAYASGDDERTVRLNHEFHRAINVAADSPKLAQLMSQITRYAPESVFPTIAGWPHQSIKDHRRVLAALAKHDSELARKAMSEHLAAGAAPLIDHLTEHGVVETP